MYMLDKEVVVFMNLFQHVKYKYGYERISMSMLILLVI